MVGLMVFDENLMDKRTMQLISKRKVEHWAKSYKERVEKLIERKNARIWIEID